MVILNESYTTFVLIMKHWTIYLLQKNLWLNKFIENFWKIKVMDSD